jgi:hypothetical protein
MPLNQTPVAMDIFSGPLKLLGSRITGIEPYSRPRAAASASSFELNRLNCAPGRIILARTQNQTTNLKRR